MPHSIRLTLYAFTALALICSTGCGSDATSSDESNVNTEASVRPAPGIPGTIEGSPEDGPPQQEPSQGEGGEEEQEEQEESDVPPQITNPAPQNELMEIQVDGATREYRLTVPLNKPTGPMPVLVAFHGGDGANYPFPQEAAFHDLAEEEGFIIAHPLAQLLPGNEGEWILNTQDESREDMNFVEAILEQLEASYAVDTNRIYATGYSLGSMFVYEIACQLSGRFAAVASFAGTMPVSPDSCDLDENVAILHIHGAEDYLISYYNTWDWKEWDSVGTMMDIPNLVDYWKNKYNCAGLSQSENAGSLHLIHEECDQEVRVEHHRLSEVGHEWPNTIGGESTHQIIWSFVSSFSKE